MKLTYRLINRTSLKYIAVIVPLGAISTAIAAVSGNSTLAALFPFITLNWLVIQMWLIDIQKKSVQQSTEMKPLFARTKQIEASLSDVAGTVVRTSNDLKSISLDFASSSLPGPAKKKLKEVAKKLTAPKIENDQTAITPFAQFTSISSLHGSSNRTRTYPVSAMVIADEFTTTALEPEWNQVLPTPQNWQRLLAENEIDLLFVESAWEGNHGTWRYHLTGKSAPRSPLVELVTECRLRGIPTVFWNKEDPPHFEDFLKSAALFDIIFTTEAAKIPEYESALGHDRVWLLPFAAQPAFHNPASLKSVKRERSSVFGGMYFREKYPERRNQMDFLLPAAAEFGLDIFSRNTSEKKYQFPSKLLSHVKGSLPYHQMVAAYHAYKVVLNVNSVPDSESMCARRIFEATACGAAVVSPKTAAITNFFPNNQISQVDNAADARSTIRALIRSDEYRERKVHVAQRQIWEKHTYSHRVSEVLKRAAVNCAPQDNTISVIVPTNRPDSLQEIIENLNRQTSKSLQLVICTHGFQFDSESKKLLEAIETVTDLTVFSAEKEATLGENLNGLIARADGSFIVRMDDDDWYGANYIGDIFNAAQFSSADLVGKAASYIFFEELNSCILTNRKSENRFSDFVRGATFAGPRTTFENLPFLDIGKSEDSNMLKAIKKAGGQIYAADRFNFVVNRRADKNTHTWSIADSELFATGEMAYVGDGTSQLSL